MYQANVYRIMLGCPSDITEEKEVAFRVLNNWNNLNSEKNRIVLLPIHWSISSYPAMGKHPQKLLNEQLVEKSDLMICIFGTRLGSPTDTEISGTVEEIKEHRKAGKDVMVFFKNSVDDISSVDLQQLQKIKDFKGSIESDVLWCEFSDKEDFERKMSEKLQLYINDNWKGSATSDTLSLTQTIEFSDDEKDIIKRWTQSRNANSYLEGVIGGVYYVFGDFRYYAKYGKEEVEFDDFIERLNKAGYIDLEKYDKYGKPVYKLKKAAYDYVEERSDKKE
ncbi:MAG: hypothetical protein II670_01940 [Alphaproteobacteria bacterium]|nr:hypothetical protein [Alphaproteobacteria bacterium]